MRILILSQFFEPEPVLMNMAFARALQAQGHEVRVLTGFPNYPGGKIYDGYKLKLIQHATIDGIRITRVPLVPDHSRSKSKRIANYVSFAASASIVGTFSGWRPDVMFVYHPPLTVGLAAWVIGLLRGVPFVYNIQDLWPDTLSATGMIGNARVLALIGRAANFVYKRAAVLLPQSPGFAQRLRDGGVPENKIRVVHNWADEQALAGGAPWPRPESLQGKFLVTFAGTMGVGQGLDAVLEAAALLKTSQPNTRLLFIGGGTERLRLEMLARTRDLENVLFLPAVPISEISGVLQAADVLLVHLRDDPLFTITIPSKIQAYLLSGKPIIIGVRGDAAELVAKAHAGIAVPPQDAVALVDAITRMAALSSAERARMGACGKAFYQKELSLTSAVASILPALEQARAN